MDGAFMEPSGRNRRQSAANATALENSQINKDKTHPIPVGLPQKNVIRWDFDQMVKWLATWV
jgi:hypothetical protein